MAHPKALYAIRAPLVRVCRRPRGVLCFRAALPGSAHATFP
ncbi:MAG: hypothetical protein U0074_11420 [Kouleothrix sp.]